MAKKKPDTPRPPRLKVSKELREFSKRVESESHSYNHKSRNNLRRGAC